MSINPNMENIIALPFGDTNKGEKMPQKAPAGAKMKVKVAPTRANGNVSHKVPTGTNGK